MSLSIMRHANARVTFTTLITTLMSVAFFITCDGLRMHTSSGEVALEMSTAQYERRVDSDGDEQRSRDRDSPNVGTPGIVQVMLPDARGVSATFSQNMLSTGEDGSGSEPPGPIPRFAAQLPPMQRSPKRSCIEKLVRG